MADFPPTESRSTLEISITRCGAPLPRACGLAQAYLCRHHSLQITLPADSSATLILRHPNLAVLSLALKMLSLLDSSRLQSFFLEAARRVGRPAPRHGQTPRRRAELAKKFGALGGGMPRGRRADLKECLVRCSCGVPCVAVGGAPPTISLVTTHYAEPFGWLKPVLSRHERLDVVIYERCSSLNAPSLAAAHRFRGPFGAALESPRCADAICRVGAMPAAAL